MLMVTVSARGPATEHDVNTACPIAEVCDKAMISRPYSANMLNTRLWSLSVGPSITETTG